MKMPAQEKAEWLLHLRSGKIQQATQVLMLPNGACCCIGVFCDRVLKLPKTLVEERNKEETDDKVLCYRFDYDEDSLDKVTQVLPHSLCLKYHTTIGAIDLNELKDRRGSGMALAQLNDAGFTFNQIADIIEYFVETED